MYLDTSRLTDFARGCDVLGSGGGGSAGDSLPMAVHAIREHEPVLLVDADELSPGGLVMPCAHVGPPEVCAERIGTGRESVCIRRHVERHFNEEVVGLLCTGVGGFNGPGSVALAAHAGLPLLDADGMGRTFPGVELVAMRLAGIEAAPSVIADEHDRVMLVHAGAGGGLERLTRSASAALGERAVSSEYVMTVEQAEKSVVTGSITKALGIGALLSDCAESGASTVFAVDRVADEFGGLRLVEGMVTDVHPVESTTATGMANNIRRAALIEGLYGDHGRLLRLEMGHEYRAVFEDGQPRATIPDIITLFDVYSGEPVLAGELRRGIRVVVLALPCPDLWRCAKGLELVGPRAFGLEIDYHPMGAS